MSRVFPWLFLGLVPTPLIAEAPRMIDAHEHGLSTLDIAMDGAALEMQLRAPGADIVGFEHAAESAEDRAAIAAALDQLSRPDTLLQLPDDAGCTLSDIAVNLAGGAGHDDHAEHGHDDHDDHAASGHGHADDDHAAAAHDDVGHDDHDDHDDHAASGHDNADDDHGAADHDESGHDNAGHDDHAAQDHGPGDAGASDGHTEFVASYRFTCDRPEALTGLALPFFEVFANASRVRVTLVGATGAATAEATRDAPVLDLP